MAENKYSSWGQLISHEKENIDYRIIERTAAPETAIIAIHGGGIEEGTSELADAVAGKDYSFYTFLGIKTKGNWDLHLDSREFIEPLCLAIVDRATQVISIHGSDIKKTEAEGDIFLGGRDVELKTRIEEHLSLAGFWVGITPIRIAALDETNICNRTRSKQGGVQIEIQANLRARMFEGNYKKRVGRSKPTEVFRKFVAAIRTAIGENNRN